MASATSYQNIAVLKKLFAEGGEAGIRANSELAEILNAAPSLASAWPDFLRNEWSEGTEHVFENVSTSDTLAPEQCALLAAMLSAGLESPALRKHYEHLIRTLFPTYANLSGLVTLLGVADESVPLAVVAGRLRVFTSIQPGMTCWDAVYGMGTILSLDSQACEIKLQQEKERICKLQSFLDKNVIVKKDSALATIIAKQPISFSTSQELYQAAMAGMITRLDVMPSLVNKMLIPAFYTADELARLSTPAGVAQNTLGSKIAGDLAKRWDYSRSLVELEGRLGKTETLDVPELNLENVKTLLTREAGRPDMALRWANVVAIMCKNTKAAEFLTAFLKDLGEKVVLWRDRDLFVDVTDHLPGKQVVPWLALTKAVAGETFLLEGTIRMPYRLWPHTEALLSAKDEHQRFVDRIFQDFREGKPSPDHYAWLWKAPKSELRTKYLADSYLLFKTLHKDQKGNYLKSQRNLHKLLLDDSAFQQAVMKDGDQEAINNLVRCVKRVPLLDSSEKQSVLVKIVRIYPEARGIVEENASQQVQAKATIDPITSIHSYLKLKEELDLLVNESIPANVAAIEDARSRGDLSENSEYKAAKELQRELGRRRAAMERDINTCKPIDFAEQEVGETVIPGAVVTLHYQDGKLEDITLLGLFDGDTAKNWFSYNSPMGRVLLTHKVGEKVHLPAGDEVTIAKLQPLSEELLEFLRK